MHAQNAGFPQVRLRSTYLQQRLAALLSTRYLVCTSNKRPRNIFKTRSSQEWTDENLNASIALELLQGDVSLVTRASELIWFPQAELSGLCSGSACEAVFSDHSVAVVPAARTRPTHLSQLRSAGSLSAMCKGDEFKAFSE